MDKISEATYQADVIAYLRGQIDEETFMRRHPGFLELVDTPRPDEQESDSDEFKAVLPDDGGAWEYPQTRGRFCRWLSRRVKHLSYRTYDLTKFLVKLDRRLYYKKEG